MDFITCAVRVHAGDVHRPGRHPARLAAAAHAADVADQRDLGDRRSSARSSSPGRSTIRLSTILGAIAVFASTTNIVSGFLITDRMLKMFKKQGAGQVSPQTIDLVYLVSAGALHLLAQVDERPEDRPQRRLRRRRGDGPRGGRHAAASRHRQLHLDLHRASCSARRRRAAVVGAADGRAAADGAVARLRRPGGRPGRHRQVLPVPARRRADRVPHRRDRASRCARAADLHGQPGGGRQAAGSAADAAGDLPGPELRQLRAARRRRPHRRPAGRQPGAGRSCSRS